MAAAYNVVPLLLLADGDGLLAIAAAAHGVGGGVVLGSR